MAKVQVNLKLDAELVREVERLVSEGYFPTKTEAFTQALRMLIRQYKAEELKRRLNRVREGTESLPSASAAVVALHEE
ncbi:MAG: ribbon-helix-helix domain-containing protein, partial [Thermofilaceae archaeon]